MKLYPPYRKWEVEINNIENFNQFLIESIENDNSNHKADFKGKLNKDGFRIERKYFHYNTYRPIIIDSIENNIKGKQFLKISIETGNTIVYGTIVISILMVLTAIVQFNFLILISIPVFVLWFYIIGFIFHKIKINKSKEDLLDILNKAKSE